MFLYECIFEKNRLSSEKLWCHFNSIFPVSRAGLVIGHNELFPGGPTHFRGRQNIIFFCHGSSGTASSQWPNGLSPVLTVWTPQSQCQSAIDGAIKYLAPPKERYTTTSASSAFPCFHSSFIKNRLALWWVMRTRNGGREASNLS